MPISRKEKSGGETAIAPETWAKIESVRGGGQALPASERDFFEPRIGKDFSDVRLHTDSKAAEASQDINARAFTIGNDVFFNTGEYKPGTGDGRFLMAHELTHTIQQGGGKGNGAVSIQRKVTTEEAVAYNKRHNWNPGLIGKLFLVSGDLKLLKKAIQEGEIGPGFIQLVISVQKRLGLGSNPGGRLGPVTQKKGQQYLVKHKLENINSYFLSSKIDLESHELYIQAYSNINSRINHERILKILDQPAVIVRAIEKTYNLEFGAKAKPPLSLGNQVELAARRLRGDFREILLYEAKILYFFNFGVGADFWMCR